MRGFSDVQFLARIHKFKFIYALSNREPEECGRRSSGNSTDTEAL
jgi:hypothetical protein